MKPVRLTIQGLQSYREAQTIDFAWLAEAGVFGIFGPTGSGKSTILDAVTLAMYGTVERAGNSIQGIMNSQEQTLSVSFTFQLDDGGARRTYTAERTYRRKPDGTVEQRVSRLLEETPDGTVVLADKAGDVNAAVESLLGLSMTDFTRAVVLPQGKFAEFLFLKGRERREMLQRLFRLERYGDELGARLSARLRRTEAAARESAAELQGLGDASPEALAAAEEALAEAVSAEEQASKAAVQAEAAFAEAARLREAMQEAETHERTLAQLAQRRPEMEAAGERLAAALAADGLLPALRERERAAEHAARLAEECAQAERVQAEAAERREAALAAAAKAELALKEREAAAAAKLERLRRASALAAQARADEEALAAVRTKLAAAGAEREAAAAELAAVRRKREEALALAAKLREEYAAVFIPAETRRRFAAAERERAAADALAAAAASLRAEAAKLAADAEGRKRTAERLALETGQSAAQLAAARALFAQGASALSSAEEALLREERRAEEALIAARSAEAAGGRLAWAHALAAELKPGQPCPVCGSDSHPAPASAPAADGTSAADWERELAALRRLRDAARREAARAADTLARLDAALAGEAGDAAFDEIAAGTEGIGAGDDLQSTEGAGGPRALLERVASRLNAVLADVLERIPRFEEARQALREERAALAAAAANAAAAQEKAAAAEREAALAAARWSEMFPEWTPETFAEALREAERKERLAEELRLRLEKSEPYLEANAAELERLSARLGEAEKAEAQAAAMAAAAERQLAERRADLEELLEGETAPPESLSAEWSERLSRWREEERAAKAALEAARAEAEEAGRRAAAASEALKEAREALARAEKQWEEALAGSGFPDAEAVRRAALDPQRKEELRRETARYAEETAIAAAKREAALARLAGRTISEEEAEEARRRFEEAKRLREAALEARARAERDIEALRLKHERWVAASRRHEEAAALQQQLAKLQTVLRGNAFVEFLAEEQLLGVTRAASERLSRLTRGRYAIELDSGGGFVIRDDANGGVRRPVSTLSGGETFLTSLALALALSAQIQLDGKYPLEFFFLDEGFGTLDPELLDNVVSALERLHMEQLAVGIISHVPELQARLPRKLIVTPANSLGEGSRVRTETT